MNTEVVAFLIGEEPGIVQVQIDRMCASDPKSRTKVEEGRRLVKMGEYEYVVVNGDKYRAIRDEESRREQNKQAKRRERARKNGQPLPGEAAFTRAMGDGNDALADEIAGRGLPEPKPLESADEVGARALRIARGEEAG